MSDNYSLDDYALEHISKDWESMLNQLKEEYKQSKAGSLVEAHLNAIIGAPPTILANIIFLRMADMWAIQNPELFALATWPVYFYLSVARTWGIRRVFEKWGILLEPRYIYNWLKARCRR